MAGGKLTPRQKMINLRYFGFHRNVGIEYVKRSIISLINE